MNQIDHKTLILTVGSCFADAIGNRLHEAKFNCLVNPFGTAYNPISIHRSLLQTTRAEQPAKKAFIHRDDLTFHYDFHSTFTSPTQQGLEEKLTRLMDEARAFLQHTDVILMTYGTAWAYVENESGEIVNNCHKMASSQFSKRLLSDQEICESFREIYHVLKQERPSLKFILTVSPVRHLKDTLPLNSVSKSTLRVACHHLSEALADVEYFPAYEIMMDDLRDYRFYKTDMLHPTDQAEDYIWDHFKTTYFNKETNDIAATWSSIRSALLHKPFNPKSSGHQRFLNDTLNRLRQMEDKIDVRAEIAAIQSQIIN